MSATFSGDKSMRVNYVQGVDSYYQSTGGEYRNPHFSGIVRASQVILEAWWSAAPALPQLPAVRVLDLACGSGEATQALQRWWGSGSEGEAGARRRGPRRLQQARQDAPESPHATPGPAPGASGSEADQHPPPPTPEPQPCTVDQTPVETTVQLENAEASSALSEQPPASSSGAAAVQSGGTAGPRPAAVHSGSTASPRPALEVDACDPYTYEAFEKWTGARAERWTFQDVADGCLADRSYHLCMCSYALHVLDDSKLFSLLLQLSLVTAHLIVLSPHKKPQIGVHTGWQLLQHSVVERVHAWLYESLNMQQ